MPPKKAPARRSPTPKKASTKKSVKKAPAKKTVKKSVVRADDKRHAPNAYALFVKRMHLTPEIQQIVKGGGSYRVGAKTYTAAQYATYLIAEKWRNEGHAPKVKFTPPKKAAAPSTKSGSPRKTNGWNIFRTMMKKQGMPFEQVREQWSALTPEQKGYYSQLVLAKESVPSFVRRAQPAARPLTGARVLPAVPHGPTSLPGGRPNLLTPGPRGPESPFPQPISPNPMPAPTAPPAEEEDDPFKPQPWGWKNPFGVFGNY